MSVYLQQAKLLLDQSELDAKEVKEAKDLLDSLTLEKTAGIGNLIHDPKFQNIVNLLTPFLVNYKVNQVLKLLQELAKEQKKFDPETGKRKYF